MAIFGEFAEEMETKKPLLNPDIEKNR